MNLEKPVPNDISDPSGEKEEPGIKPEHVPQIVEEAKKFLAEVAESPKAKLDGIRNRQNYIEQLANYFRDQSQGLLDGLDREGGGEVTEEELDGERRILDKITGLLDGASQCREILRDLRIEAIRYSDGSSLSFLEVYRAQMDAISGVLNAVERMNLEVMDLEDVKHVEDNLKSCIRSAEATIPGEIINEKYGLLMARIKQTKEKLHALWEEKGGGVKYEEGVGLVIDEEVKRPRRQG